MVDTPASINTTVELLDNEGLDRVMLRIYWKVAVGLPCVGSFRCCPRTSSESTPTRVPQVLRQIWTDFPVILTFHA